MPRQRVRLRHLGWPVPGRRDHVSGRLDGQPDAYHWDAGRADRTVLPGGHLPVTLGSGNQGTQSSRMNLRQLFDLSLVNRRDQVALEWLGAQYTFGEIDARSNRVANALKASGLKQGDRVCVYLA